jgi:hypothetical protein
MTAALIAGVAVVLVVLLAVPGAPAARRRGLGVAPRWRRPVPAAERRRAELEWVEALAA